MSKVLAVINFLDRHGRPVDPGYGVGEGSPDNSLPGGGGPVDPGYGVGRPGPVDPGFGIPLPPVHRPVDPGYGVPGGSIDNSLPPTYPARPDNGLPSPPQMWPKPPLGIWPPPQPVYPSHPIYPASPGKPDQGLPPDPGKPSNPIALPPGSVWPPLPPEIGGPILCFCWIVGVGYRWVVLDPAEKPEGFPDNTLPGGGGEHPSHPISGGGNRPDNSLPGNKPQPK